MYKVKRRRGADVVEMGLFETYKDAYNYVNEIGIYYEDAGGLLWEMEIVMNEPDFEKWLTDGKQGNAIDLLMKLQIG